MRLLEERADARSLRTRDRLLELCVMLSLPAPEPLRRVAREVLASARELPGAPEDERSGRIAALEELLERGSSRARETLARDLEEIGRAAGDGFTPMVEALSALQGPEGSLARHAQEERTRLRRELETARRLVGNGAGTEASEAALPAVAKAVERARATARWFPPPRASAADRSVDGGAWKPLGEPGGLLEVLNAAYYRARGDGIYDDFQTLVGSDPLLANADALDFARRVESLVRGAGGLPETLGVLEAGIGSGRFAGAFLDALGRAAPELYRRVRYVLCDLSEPMLTAALGRPELAAHRERLVPLVGPVPERLPDHALDPSTVRGGRLLFARFFELFSDLPGTELVYRDREGDLHRLLARPLLRGREDLRRRDSRSVEPARALAWVEERDVDALAALEPESLARFEWEGRFEPLPEGALPRGLDPELVFFGERDLLVPVPLGGCDTLARVLALLDPAGWLRLSDYGLVGAGPHLRSVPLLSQAVRRYGGNWTLNLHFPLLAWTAATRGREVSVSPTSAYVASVVGEPVCPIAPYYARFGAANLIRDVSGPVPLLRVDELAHAPALREWVRDLGPVTDESEPEPEDRARHDDRAAAWRRLVSEAERRDWLRPGLPLHDADPEAPLLDSLAQELDFVVNAVFVRHAAPALAAGREWYTARELEAIVRDLVGIGWSREAVEDAIEARPERVRFWTLTAEPRPR